MAAAKKQPPRKRAAKKAAPRKRAAKKAAPRKRAPRRSAAERAQAEAEEIVVRWATTHGAPVRILEGWDPDDGTWTDTSTIGQMLRDIRNGTHITVAAKALGIQHIGQLLQTCSDHAYGAPENRAYIALEWRPFVDLFRAIESAEAGIEIAMTDVIVTEARKNPALAMQFLARRFPTRWREQQQVHMVDNVDDRDAAISRILEDPDAAFQLAEFAERVERDTKDRDDEPVTK